MHRIKDTHCLSLFHKIRVAGHPILVLPDFLAHEEHLSKPSLVLLKEIRHLSFPLLSMVPIRVVYLCDIHICKEHRCISLQSQSGGLPAIAI